MAPGYERFHRRDLLNKNLTAAINDECPNEDSKQWAATHLNDGKFEVYKLGRSTGDTRAHLNTVSGQQVTYGSRTSGHLIVTASVLVAVDLSKNLRPFVKEGDSGSLVVDRYGTAVGVVVAAGGKARNPMQITMIVPIDEVLEDVERKLGEFWSADIKVELV